MVFREATVSRRSSYVAAPQAQRNGSHNGTVASRKKAPQARHKVARGEREARCPWDL
jgi:hypothetical protein